ncbi:BTAD domain-containing putative transcriptional regulator [Streptomyces gamaensis]|uniref:BTAD domain-containing putative transcriptional regulator n=1 Tax=Streptomyces gamaensis TaxID=1763542 RepID=UPI003AA91C01
MRLSDGPEVVVLPPAKPTVLLAVLLLRPDSVVPTEFLRRAIWGDEQPSSAKAALHACVLRLRKTFAKYGVDSALIESVPGGYRISLAPGALDLADFRELRSRATRETGAEDELCVLKEALALWQGPLLSNVPSDLLRRDELPRLVEERLRVVERACDIELALGRCGQALVELWTAVRAHPGHERFREQLIEALYRTGRQSEALAEYRAVRTYLREELGVDPGPGLRRLELAILRGEELEGPVPAGRVPSTGAASGIAPAPATGPAAPADAGVPVGSALPPGTTRGTTPGAAAVLVGGAGPADLVGAGASAGTALPPGTTPGETAVLVGSADTGPADTTGAGTSAGTVLPSGTTPGAATVLADGANTSPTDTAASAGAPVGTALPPGTTHGTATVLAGGANTSPTDTAGAEAPAGTTLPPGATPGAAAMPAGHADTGPAGTAHGPGIVPTPPPRSALPLAPVNCFTGRDHETAELTARLTGDTPALVVVSGAPGVGKSALALHTARAVAGSFPHGVFVVRLTDADGRPRPVAEAVAELRAQAGPSGPGPGSLLVLDDAYGAPQVRPLLAANAGAAVLVTARPALSGLVAAHGGWALRLEPLGADASCRLLTAVLGEARTGPEPGALRELAEACGHFPLALRIAVARLLTRPRLSMAGYVAWLGAAPVTRLALPDDPRMSVPRVFQEALDRIDPVLAEAFSRFALSSHVRISPAVAARSWGTVPAAAEEILERLAEAGLLDEGPAGVYQAPGLLRDFVRATSGARFPDRAPAVPEHHSPAALPSGSR